MQRASTLDRLVKSRWALPAIALILGLAARLFLAITFYGNFDQDSYDLVAGLMLQGKNVYVETARYNYAPVWAYILEALARIAIHYHAEYHIVVRGFLTFVDVGVAAVIGMIAARLRPGSGRFAFSAYLLNPVAILLVGYHGQFENLAMLPMLLAVYLTTGKHRTRSSTLVIWLLATASLLTKHLVVFSIWMFFVYVFTERRYLVAMALSVISFLLSFTPFLPSGLNGIIRNLILYGELSSSYGTGLLPVAMSDLFALFHHATDGRLGAILIGGANDVDRLLLVGVMGALPFLAKRWLKLSLIDALELSTVALLSLIYIFGEQYFILPVIVGSIRRSRAYWAYSTVTTLLLFTSPVNIHLIDLPYGQFYLAANVVWLSLLVWFGSVAINARHRESLRQGQFADSFATSRSALQP